MFKPCPGREVMFGECHSIIDSETGSPMVNFAACSNYVKSAEVLLPAARGIFVPGLPHPRSKICDLRFDSNRFTRYFDAIQIMAERAKDRDEVPDTTDLQNLIRRFALIPECQRDAKLGDSKWHIIPGLPNFTVCEDCFENFVCLVGQESLPLPWGQLSIGSEQQYEAYFQVCGGYERFWAVGSESEGTGGENRAGSWAVRGRR
jgi:hypothetical protein